MTIQKMPDDLPPYISPNDVKHVAEYIKGLEGVTWEELARASLIAYYAPRSDLFKNPALMSLVISCLVKRLGGKVKVSQDELDHAAGSALHTRVDESVTPATIDLLLSSLIPVSDEPKTIN